jgi:hypothetical protein
MSAKGILGAALVGAAALGGGAVLLSGDLEEGVTDGGLDGQAQIVETAPVYEHKVLQRGFTTDGGRTIRAVGVSSGQRIEDVESGRLVIVDELPADAICPAVFSAPMKEVDKNKWPVIPTLDQYFEESGFRPVPISGSKLGNSYVWHGYVLGQTACIEMTKYGNFYGSSMKEFLALPIPLQKRFLRTKGICDGEPCTVPAHDARAIPGADIYFPHSLSQRADINFVRSVDGGPVDRYATPDDGFADPDAGVDGE